MGGVIDFNKLSQGRKAVSFANKGKMMNKKIAAACGAVKEDRRKNTKFV